MYLNNYALNIIEEAGAYFYKKINDGANPTELSNEVLRRYRRIVGRGINNPKMVNTINTLKSMVIPALGGLGALTGYVVDPFDNEAISTLAGAGLGLGASYFANEPTAKQIEKIPKKYYDYKINKAKARYSKYVDPVTGELKTIEGI